MQGSSNSNVQPRSHVALENETQVRVTIVTQAHLRMCMSQDNGGDYSIEGFDLIELIPQSVFLSIGTFLMICNFFFYLGHIMNSVPLTVSVDSRNHEKINLHAGLVLSG